MLPNKLNNSWVLFHPLTASSFIVSCFCFRFSIWSAIWFCWFKRMLCITERCISILLRVVWAELWIPRIRWRSNSTLDRRDRWMLNSSDFWSVHAMACSELWNSSMSSTYVSGRFQTFLWHADRSALTASSAMPSSSLMNACRIGRIFLNCTSISRIWFCASCCDVSLLLPIFKERTMTGSSIGQQSKRIWCKCFGMLHIRLDTLPLSTDSVTHV